MGYGTPAGSYEVISLTLPISPSPRPADPPSSIPISILAGTTTSPGTPTFESSSVITASTWTVADGAADLVAGATYELVLYSDVLSDIARFEWRMDTAVGQAALTTESGADTYLHTPTSIVPESGKPRLSVKAITDPTSLSGGGYYIKLVRMS